MPSLNIELTDEEYDIAFSKAVAENCPSITEYLRQHLFDDSPSHDYEELLWQMEMFLEEAKPGTRFLIRDCIEKELWISLTYDIKRNLEKMVFHTVTKGELFPRHPIVPDGKDSQGVQWYKKD